jgi:hypothetical protein
MAAPQDHPKHPCPFLFAVIDEGRYHSVISAVVEAISNVEFFLSLESEELGAKLLFLAKDRGMYFPSSFENEIWEDGMRRRPT